MNNNYKNHYRNKVSFIWVLITFVIITSMAFANESQARTVQQYNEQRLTQQAQRDIDFPVLEHWPAGNGEQAVWVNSRQQLDAVGMDGLELSSTVYKINFDSRQPLTRLAEPSRNYKRVAKIKFLSW